jgi:hypothetical protein
MKVSTLFLVTVLIASSGCRAAGATTELQKVRAGTMDIVILSSEKSLRRGKERFVIEFRSTTGGELVDVGNVKGSASMPMAGMPMFGSLDVQRTDVPGRYNAACDFAMAGTWRMALEWDKAGAPGSVTFPGTVQ